MSSVAGGGEERGAGAGERVQNCKRSGADKVATCYKL